MVYGYSRGFRDRRGAGMGFRGGSPPWPYIGRGRGGLPRCRYPETPAYFRGTQAGREVDWLKSQADALKAELGRIEAMMRDIEAGRTKAS